MTPAKLRLAQAAMAKPDTKVGDLCQELGITRATLYRHVSPTGALPTGELPEAQASAMLGMGEWLSRYGESIYGTRAGPISPRPWGVTTSRGSQVYVHILDWTDEWLFLPLVGHAERATLLRSGQAVSLRQLPGGVEIRLPPRLKGEWDQVVAITAGGRTATRR